MGPLRALVLTHWSPKLGSIPNYQTVSSPTVTLVRNGPLNTACRTLIEESSGCEDDQAALQGAENRSCLAQVMRSGTVGLGVPNRVTTRSAAYLLCWGNTPCQGASCPRWLSRRTTRRPIRPFEGQELNCSDPVCGLVFFQTPEDKKPKVFVIFTQRAFQNAQIVKWTI